MMLIAQDLGHGNRRLLPSVDSRVNKSSFRQDAEPARWKRALPRISAETAPNAFGAPVLRLCVNEAAGDWPRQLVLFSLDSMGSAVAFSLAGASISIQRGISSSLSE